MKSERFHGGQATQIPGIDARRFPPGLAGARYPDGIAIVPEQELDALCRRERIDTVVFAYSDVSHADVMHVASRALAAALCMSTAQFTRAPPASRASASRASLSGTKTICRWLGSGLKLLTTPVRT